jgi:hypothetical protein
MSLEARDKRRRVLLAVKSHKIGEESKDAYPLCGELVDSVGEGDMCSSVAEQTAESEGARTRAMLFVIRGLVHRTSRYCGHCALVGLENQEDGELP